MGGGAKTTTKTNETSNQTVQLPQWMLDAGQGLFNQANTQAQNNPAVRYTGSMTPAMAANQTAAGNVAATAAGGGGADLNAARAATMGAAYGSAPMVQTGQTAASGMTAAQAGAQGYRPAQQQVPGQNVGVDKFDGAQASAYMSPYNANVQQNVLAAMPLLKIRRCSRMRTALDRKSVV